MRPKGVADAQTVEIPSPPKELSMGTHPKCWSRELVPVAIEGNKYRSPAWRVARKAMCISAAPVPQTDTGRQGEDPKTNGRTLVKELGKLTP